MHAPKKAALLSSGGKDSVLALEYARRGHAEIAIVQLVTCLSQAYDRVSMHGVRRALIQDQADALGLPVEFVVIPSHGDAPCPMAGTDFPPNDVYSTAMLAALGRLKGEGVEVVVFGDIFLEDLRAYRDNLLAHAEMAGRYPLWGRHTAALYDEFVGLGYKAITVCVDSQRLTEEHCGRLLDEAFRDSLPEEVDACGERGEYHSFTFDGPAFARPVPYTLGDLHRQAPFVFRELFPGVRDAHSAAQRPATAHVR
jgi:uncharacterized protein (TIGR00290 family)